MACDGEDEDADLDFVTRTCNDDGDGDGDGKPVGFMSKTNKTRKGGRRMEGVSRGRRRKGHIKMGRWMEIDMINLKYRFIEVVVVVVVVLRLI